MATPANRGQYRVFVILDLYGEYRPKEEIAGTLKGMLVNRPGDPYDFRDVTVYENLADIHADFQACEGCAGTGIRPYANEDRPPAGPPQKGFTIVERCDACAQFANDLEAAKFWGTEARWMEGNETCQAIAKPK